MKNSFKIQKLLYLLLIVLPIIDNIYKFREDESSPAVIIRAFATVIMLYMLIRIRPLGQSSRHIIGIIVFLLVYIVFISFIFAQETWVVYGMVKLLYPFIGFILIYYMTKQSLTNEKSFAVFFFIVIIIISVNAYLNIGNRMDTTRGLEEADNTGSMVMCVYAGVLLLSKRRVFPVVIFFAVVGVLLSGKRGAVLGMALASIPLLKYLFTSYSRNVMRKIFLLIIAIVAVFLAMRWFGDFFNATFGRFERLEDDGGSGRDMIYSAYWYRFLDSHPLLQIFGHGFRSAAYGSGSRYAFESHAAHNDWLQLLFDFGLVSIITYTMIFIKMILVVWDNRKKKDANYYMLVMTIILWISKSATSSTFLMTANSIYLYMTAAYAIAKLEQNKTQNDNNQVLEYDPSAVSS